MAGCHPVVLNRQFLSQKYEMESCGREKVEDYYEIY